MARGRIYVLSSQSQLGFVKIGKTLRTAEDRASELDGTALALPLETVYEVVTEAFDQVERKAHFILEKKRARLQREWFQCDPSEAIAAIKLAIEQSPDAKIIGETDYIGAKAQADQLAKQRIDEDRQKEERRRALDQKNLADQQRLLEANLAQLGLMLHNSDNDIKSQIRKAIFKLRFRVLLTIVSLIIYFMIFEGDAGPKIIGAIFLIGFWGVLYIWAATREVEELKKTKPRLPEKWEALWNFAVQEYGLELARQKVTKALSEVAPQN
jgi:hypothetical protein